MHIKCIQCLSLRYSLSFSPLQPITFVSLLTFCLLRASSSVEVRYQRSGDELHAIGSFSTDPGEDEIILNEENLRPEYSQTKDTAIDDHFRLQGDMPNHREERDDCVAGRYRHSSEYPFTVKCKSKCQCSDCKEWKKVCKGFIDSCEVCLKCALINKQ